MTRLAALAGMLARDVRLACRGLGRTPVFTSVALGIFAVGIGANTTIYGLVHAALFSPSVPYRHAERAIRIYADRAAGPGRERPGIRWLSHPEFVEIGRQDDIFALAAAASDGQVWSLESGGRTTTVLGEVWSASLLSIIDFAPSLGRRFTLEEDRPGSASVVILSYQAWQRIFGSDPAVVGRSIRLNGRPVTVVGVGPRAFKGTLVVFATDFWIPWGTASIVDPAFEKVDDRASRSVRVFAELRPGVSEAQARARIDRVAAGLAAVHPDTNVGIGLRIYEAPSVRMDPLFDRALGPLSILVMTAAGLGLLVACSNLAGMLLGRALSRQREVAVRLALGASRRRLLGQFLTESVLLGLLGGGCGLILATWLVDAFATLDLPLPVTLTLNVDFGGGVLAFALGLSIATSVLFGLAPALCATRGGVMASIKGPGAAAAGGRRRLSLQNLLVVFQVAVSGLLLVGAGLFARSASETSRVAVPFEEKQIAFVSVDCSLGGVGGEAEGRTLFSQYRDRVAALPGVDSVAIASHMPLSLWGLDRAPVGTGAEVPGGRADRSRSAVFNAVTPEFFSTLRIPLSRGRGFTDRDAAGGPRVIIISETMAREWFGRRNPVGELVRVGAPEGEVAMQVVGVVRDVPALGLREPAQPAFYVPFAQAYRPAAAFIARTSAPGLTRDAMRRELERLAPRVPILEARTMQQQLAGQTAPWRIGGRFLMFFGLGTLALAGVGLFGVVSFAVSQRTREIGIRIALGAGPAHVVGEVLRHGLALFAAGAFIGVGIGALATSPLTRFLPGVSPGDPATCLGVLFVLGASCALATWLPARHAARVDPIESLRES